MSELNRDEIISDIDTKIKWAKFINTNAVVLSCKAAQFCLEHAQFYERKIKELTEESKKWEQAYECADSACRELSDKCERLTEENERLAKHNAVLIEDNHILATEFKGITKADTVRKMQERLKAHFDDDLDFFRYSHDYIRCVIDQIAKEMMEEEK